MCDLDGTLLHTAPDIADAVNLVLHELGRASVPESVVAGYVGQGVDVLLHRVLSGDIDGRIDTDLHVRARTLLDSAYSEVNGRRTSLYAGVVEGLDAFRAMGVRLACVTNKPQQPSDSVLARFGLDRYFEFVLGGEALPQRKPQPEPLWHAAHLLGVPVQACIMLGDSANDAKAARAADMPSVLVDYGYTEGRPVNEIDCDAVISRFGELADAIAARKDARFDFLWRTRTEQAIAGGVA
ncbi:MAG: phosphoglycolate phosphatase [Dokdonella sp.]